jgi:hypothetical protein
VTSRQCAEAYVEAGLAGDPNQCFVVQSKSRGIKVSHVVTFKAFDNCIINHDEDEDDHREKMKISEFSVDDLGIVLKCRRGLNEFNLKTMIPKAIGF